MGTKVYVYRSKVSGQILISFHDYGSVIEPYDANAGGDVFTKLEVELTDSTDLYIMSNRQTQYHTVDAPYPCQIIK